MTLKELHEAVAEQLRCHPASGDAIVGVETRNGGCPTRYKAKVTSANIGFDWDHGAFIIRTEEPLCCVRMLDQPVKELAKAWLEKLKNFHATTFRGGAYIPKAREQAWLDGFVEGVKYHITSANEQILQEDDEKRKQRAKI